MVLQSLDRGMLALKLIAEKGALSVTELAKEMGVDKSTVSRVLETLRKHDMVQLEKNSRKYHLGFRLMYLGERMASSIEIIDIARPVLMEVSRYLGQSVHLCAYNKASVYVIDQIVSSLPYTMSARIGMIEPLHSSSVGKCILAYRTEQRREEILEDYEMTPYLTITDPCGIPSGYRAP